MNTKKLYHIALLAVAGLALSVQAQNTLISGDLNVATNWDDGVLPSTANPGNNPGIINTDNVLPNQGTLTTISDLIIQQTGGNVSATSFGWHDLNGSTEWTVSGGNLNVGSFGLRIQNSSVLTISGGSVTGGDRWNNDNVLNVSAGTASTGILRGVSGSEFNFSGGTTTVTNEAFNDALSGNNGAYTVNFSGTSSFSAGTFGGVNAGGTTVNIGAGSGSISATTLEWDDFTFDWTSGSGFSFTASGFSTGTSWEDVWTAGNLTVDGVKSGTFASNFNDAGGTLTLIPEPSTFALMGLAGLAVFFLRRRR